MSLTKDINKRIEVLRATITERTTKFNKDTKQQLENMRVTIKDKVSKS